MTLCSCGYPLTAEGACPWCGASTTPSGENDDVVCWSCDPTAESTDMRPCRRCRAKAWGEEPMDAAAPTGTEEGRDG